MTAANNLEFGGRPCSALPTEVERRRRCVSPSRRRTVGTPSGARSHDTLALSALQFCVTETYFIAPKRLSNEFDETIGADPATLLSLVAAGARSAAGVSDTDGFNARPLAACFGSAF